MYSPLLGRVRRVAVFSGILTLLICLSKWGGTVRPGPLFVMGVVLLASLILAFGALMIWLYKDRQPVASSPQSVKVRQVISVLALGSTASFILGGNWDELWHRRYGGFGQDFLWPPHMLIYAGLLLFAVFAGGGLWFTLRRSGTVRERFQAEPHIGLLSLVCTFLVVSLPSDELWHRIYGRDITAWSLPHIILASGVVFIALVASSLARSLSHDRNWQSITTASIPEWLALFLIATATIMLVQLGTTEWEDIKYIPSQAEGAFAQAFWQRPMWLYPVVVVSIALFSSMFALNTLHRFGAATVIAIVVIGWRFTMLSILGAESQQLGLGYVSYLLLLPPAVTLDVWYWRNRQRLDDRNVLLIGSVLAGITFLIVALPVIDRALIYPFITTHTVPSMVLIGLIMAMIAAWSGEQFSRWLHTLDPSFEVGQHYHLPSWTHATIGLSIICAFVITIFLTAQPPQGLP